jgi:hypothetical protein
MSENVPSTYPWTDMPIIIHQPWEDLSWIDKSLMRASSSINKAINANFIPDGSLNWTIPECSMVARELWIPPYYFDEKLCISSVTDQNVISRITTKTLFDDLTKLQKDNILAFVWWWNWLTVRNITYWLNDEHTLQISKDSISQKYSIIVVPTNFERDSPN